MKHKPLSELCDQLSVFLQRSPTFDDDFIQFLEQLTEAKSLASFTEEKPLPGQPRPAELLIKYMVEVIERGLTQAEPIITIERLKSWLKRLQPVLLTIPSEASMIFLTKIQRLLQAHRHYAEAIQSYHYGVEAKLSALWQSSQLALLTGIALQEDCTPVFREQLGNEIILFLERSSIFMDNPLVWLDRWLRLAKINNSVTVVREDHPVPWSQLIIDCPVNVQYEQCMRWLSALQAHWQQVYAARSSLSIEIIVNTMYDFWTRSRPLALTLKKEKEWHSLWQMDLLAQLSTLWPTTEEAKEQAAPFTQFKDRWSYLQTLLTQWFALLQLHWPASWSTAVADEKSSPSQFRTYHYLDQQFEVTNTIWQTCLTKLVQDEKAPDSAKIRQLRDRRQLLCQTIRDLDPKHRPLWAEKLEGLLNSKLTEQQCGLLVSRLPPANSEDLGELEWAKWQLILGPKASDEKKFKAEKSYEKKHDTPLSQIQRSLQFALALLGSPPVPLQLCLVGSLTTGLATSASDIDLEILIAQDTAMMRSYIKKLYQLIRCMALLLGREVDRDGLQAHTPWQLVADTWIDPSGIQRLLEKSETHARWHLSSLCASNDGESLLTDYYRFRQQVWGNPLDSGEFKREGDEAKEDKEDKEGDESFLRRNAIHTELLEWSETRSIPIQFKKINPESKWADVARMFLLEGMELQPQWEQLIQALNQYIDPTEAELLKNLLYGLLITGQLTPHAEIKLMVQKHQQDLQLLKDKQFVFSEVESVFYSKGMRGLQELIERRWPDAQSSQSLGRALRSLLSQRSIPDDKEYRSLIESMSRACENKQRLYDDFNHLSYWGPALLQVQNEKNKLLTVMMRLLARQRNLNLRLWEKSPSGSLIWVSQIGVLANRPINLIIEAKDHAWFADAPCLEEIVKPKEKKSVNYTTSWSQKTTRYFLRRYYRPKSMLAEAPTLIEDCHHVFLLPQQAAIPSPKEPRVLYLQETKAGGVNAYMAKAVKPKILPPTTLQRLQENGLVFSEEESQRIIEKEFVLKIILICNYPLTKDQSVTAEQYLAMRYLTAWVKERQSPKYLRLDSKGLLSSKGIDLKKDFLGPLIRLIDFLTVLARINLRRGESPYPIRTEEQIDELVKYRFLAFPFAVLIKKLLNLLVELRERVHLIWQNYPFHPQLTPQQRDIIFQPGQLPKDYPSQAVLSDKEWDHLQRLEILVFQSLCEDLIGAWQTHILPKEWDPLRLRLMQHRDDQSLVRALIVCWLSWQINPVWLNHYCHVMNKKQLVRSVKMVQAMIADAKSFSSHQQAVLATLQTYPFHLGLRPFSYQRDCERAWQQQLLDLTLPMDSRDAAKAPVLYWHDPLTQTIMHRVLRPNDIKQLFTEVALPLLNRPSHNFSKEESKGLDGTRFVIPLHDTKTSQVLAYLKCFPQWPLRQRLSAIIDYQFTGDYLPHTQMHLFHPVTKRHYPVLISKARGTPIKDKFLPLEKMPELLAALPSRTNVYELPRALAALDLHEFALGVLMSVWLGCGDGSPGNMSLDETRWVKRLFAHDADCLFAQAWQRQREWIFGQQKLPGIKSVYFGMPQMRDPIPNTVIEMMSRLSAVPLLEYTLQVLTEEEAQYQVSGYKVRLIDYHEQKDVSVPPVAQQAVNAHLEILILKTIAGYELGYCEAKTGNYRQQSIVARSYPDLISRLQQYRVPDQTLFLMIPTDVKLRSMLENWVRTHGGVAPAPPLEQKPTPLQWSRAQILAFAQGSPANEQTQVDRCSLPMFFPKAEIARLYKHLLELQLWLSDQQRRARQARRPNPSCIDLLYAFTDTSFARQVEFLLIYHPKLAPHQRFALLNHSSSIKKMQAWLQEQKDEVLLSSHHLPMPLQVLRTSQMFDMAKEVGQSSSVVMSNASSEHFLRTYYLEEKSQQWQKELSNAREVYGKQYAIKLRDELLEDKIDRLQSLLTLQREGVTVEKVLQLVGNDSRQVPLPAQRTLIPLLSNYREFSFQQLDFSNWSLWRAEDLQPLLVSSRLRLKRLRLVNCDALNNSFGPILQSTGLQQLTFLELGGRLGLFQLGTFRDPLNLPQLQHFKFRQNDSIQQLHLKCPQLNSMDIRQCTALWLMEWQTPRLQQLIVTNLPALRHWLLNSERWSSELALAMSIVRIKREGAAASVEIKTGKPGSGAMQVEESIWFELFERTLQESSLLHRIWLMAARRGRLDILQDLWVMIHSPAQLEKITNQRGDTALHLAAALGHTVVIDWLCHQGFSINLPNRRGHTALQRAIGSEAQRSFTAVACLLQHKADITASMSGLLPAHQAWIQNDLINLTLIESTTAAREKEKEEKKGLWHAAYIGAKESLTVLLSSKEIKLEARTVGLTSLHVAIWRGHTAIVNQLITARADVNPIHHHQISPLHLAAALGYLDIVQALLIARADINALSDEKRTALHYAATEGHEQVVQQLLQSKASLCIWSQSLDEKKKQSPTTPTSPLHLATQRGHNAVLRILLRAIYAEDENAQGHSPLTLAVIAGHHDTLRLLLETKANINAASSKNHQHTALHQAVRSRQPMLLQYLLDNKANPEAQNQWGRTALHLAALAGQTFMVTLLIQADARLDAADQQGSRPLHLALENPTTVQALIDAKADLHQVDSESRTALHHVVTHGTVAVALILLEAKADINARSRLGKTPLFTVCEEMSEATEAHYFPMIQLLLRYRADITLKARPYYTDILTDSLFGSGGVTLEEKLLNECYRVKSLLEDYKKESQALKRSAPAPALAMIEEKKATEALLAKPLFAAVFAGLVQLKGPGFQAQFPSLTAFQDELLQQLNQHLEKEVKLGQTLRQLIQMVANIPNEDRFSIEAKRKNEKIAAYQASASRLFIQHVPQHLDTYFDYLSNPRTIWGSNIELHLAAHACEINMVIEQQKSQDKRELIFSTDNRYPMTLHLQKARNNNLYTYHLPAAQAEQVLRI